jgi:hypothetical protein
VHTSAFAAGKSLEGQHWAAKQPVRGVQCETSAGYMDAYCADAFFGKLQNGCGEGF